MTFSLATAFVMSLTASITAQTATSFTASASGTPTPTVRWQVSADLGVSIPTAGWLMTGYALGVFVGAPILTLATRRLPPKTTLLALMALAVFAELIHRTVGVGRDVALLALEVLSVTDKTIPFVYFQF